jgi:hypothetical protein
MNLTRPPRRTVGQRRSAVGTEASLYAGRRAKKSPGITPELYGALVKANECGDGGSGSATATLAVAVRTPDGAGRYRKPHRATEATADVIATGIHLSPIASANAAYHIIRPTLTHTRLWN